MEENIDEIYARTSVLLISVLGQVDGDGAEEGHGHHLRQELPKL